MKYTISNDVFIQDIIPTKYHYIGTNNIDSLGHFCGNAQHFSILYNCHGE